jgi:hypothetical protein
MEKLFSLPSPESAVTYFHEQTGDKITAQSLRVVRKIECKGVIWLLATHLYNAKGLVAPRLALSVFEVVPHPKLGYFCAGGDGGLPLLPPDGSKGKLQISSGCSGGEAGTGNAEFFGQVLDTKVKTIKVTLPSGKTYSAFVQDGFFIHGIKHANWPVYEATRFWKPLIQLLDEFDQPFAQYRGWGCHGG